MLAGPPRGPARGRNIAIAVGIGALLGAALPGPAAGDDGGAAASPRPVVRGVACVRACAGGGRARAGSTVRVTGTALADVQRVVFLGARGGRDDAPAQARRRSARRVAAVLPARAVSGPVAVVSADGQVSRPSRRALAVAAAAGGPASPSAASPLVGVALNATRVYFGARRPATLTYVLRTRAPRDVRVDVASAASGLSVAHWIAYAVRPGVAHAVRWNGRAGAAVPPDGRYEFRIAVGRQPRPARSATAPASQPAPSGAAIAGAFEFRRWMFPVRGRHDYGGAGARFGAGRSGHSHQGQDVMAACGTRVVAARGGRVRWRDFQSLAGNYIVIDSAASGVDTVYMHLRDPALVDRGGRVYTGQTIGYVGRTGDASACHLHFEMWSPPGWYSGGAPFDPLPWLRAWDR